MTLYLIESGLKERTTEEVGEILERIATFALKSNGELIEAQIGEDRERLFLILEAIDRPSVQQILEIGGLTPDLVKEARLVGQDLASVRERKDKANYLVQWNLPAGLTMDAYLQRKAEKTPLYAKVPEVSFERTYVCEDLSKCLCFYDSPDEAGVKRAREAVGAPIDSLTPIRKVH
ncbi:DUF4242 domain-containing protein [Pannus brasiliensis CCIBt3594]|uniref:DUF4242 domain-containing protein n=1 Tax=Pannus brasiliensis CCIBt3594 TaxID=1427578 RepID=A0AAW9QVT4_9CHRO